MMEVKTWADCAAFHGHECGGLTIGWKAALYAIKLLDTGRAEDEEVVCICENDACGVDAIQVMLGCTAGKGNLLFHLTGKQAFNIYERKSGRSVRLVLKKRPDGMTREESLAYYQSREPEELFDVKETRIALPEPARIFWSHDCDVCGENTAEAFLHVREGKYICRDCYKAYSRFDV